MKLEGIIAYPITPFKAESQEIDFDALTITLNALLEHQCDAIAPLGSAGESAYLSWQEWQQVAQTSIEVVNHRVPVVLGISELTTAMAIQKAKNQNPQKLPILFGFDFLLFTYQNTKLFYL